MDTSGQFVDWLAPLDGDDNEIAAATQLFANSSSLCLVRESLVDRPFVYCLKSSRFQNVPTLDAIRPVAADVLNTMKGAIALQIGRSSTLQLSTRVHPIGIRADGSKLVQFPFTIDFPVSVEFLATVAVGGPPIPYQKPEALRLWEFAERNQCASDALKYFARCDNWFDLYMMFEAIKKGVGGEEEVARLGRTSRSQIDLVRATANSYRHAYTYQPRNAIPFREARELLQQIVRAWLKEDEGGGAKGA